MTEDHYVARTYLKHFGDSNRRGMLHGYRKPDGSTFPCWPRDVCRDWDGDINPTLNNPELLGIYRAYFEPHWNPSIAKIEAGRLEKYDKWAIAGYMANLMACVPAWHRASLQAETEMSALAVREKLRAQKRHGGALRAEQEQLLAFLDSGQRLPLDPDESKALAVRDLIDYAWLTYNADWGIVHNDSGQPFITSDNPFAFGWSGRPGEPVRRFLSVTPAICVYVSFDPAKHDDRTVTPELIEAGLRLGPRGTVRRTTARPIEVREINKLIVQCAETRVFCSESIPELPRLIQNYGKYRLEAKAFGTPAPRGIHVGNSFVVRERTNETF